MSRAVCAVILVMSVLTIGAAPALAQTSGPPYTLTFTPPTGGKVQGAGINCGAGGTACSVTMPAAMTLGLSATASAGYAFTAWTGDCTGTTTSLWLFLGGPRACGATFTPVGGTPTTPVITWPTPAPITQGTALSAAQLNATTTVAGIFMYSPGAGTVLPAGSYTLSTTFTPTNTSLYTSASKSVTQVVNAPAGLTTPVITWPTPAPITQGTALSATQLNATTTVAGTFVYSPGAGTVLSAGSYTLSTTFTPTNTSLYTSASKSVTQVVNAQASTTAGSFTVYDASDAVVGPLIGSSTVALSVGGHHYVASAGPDGWLQADVTLYFFDAGCTAGPYSLRSWLSTGTPPTPDPMPSYFFRSLSTVGSTGYYITGQYVSRALSVDVPNVWYRDSAAGPCTPLGLAGAAWFDLVGVVQLPAHQTPFTIR
ncbi:MAG: hypothetical protein R6W83_08580 [Cryobacterium sp.]